MQSILGFSKLRFGERKRLSPDGLLLPEFKQTGQLSNRLPFCVNLS